MREAIHVVLSPHNLNDIVSDNGTVEYDGFSLVDLHDFQLPKNKPTRFKVWTIGDWFRSNLQHFISAMRSDPLVVGGGDRGCAYWKFRRRLAAAAINWIGGN